MTSDAEREAQHRAVSREDFLSYVQQLATVSVENDLWRMTWSARIETTDAGVRLVIDAEEVVQYEPLLSVHEQQRGLAPLEQVRRAQDALRVEQGIREQLRPATPRPVPPWER